ncbi:hypothetical protein Kpol_1048p32 [Vanderwaltozyma polyspora DSM 70294]|uniref:Prephenate dehydrogenase [NADP(+)] n=1 Tax=Vanderwaltozyma polyspora (strain ATCC 22028 / DSM 70294 / BCRC 21397 / CBS 2163 / NBRC 10782 / NRRL Y-8283 / UCD 57-17) TaxID=436907 RepID=A7TGJ4_VANPO|nr:uncharacterized protein Kpol_1048p32 [Vanderwaltozyma polyspora DSM 70294]EDO18601.1 hypothetical protein Kpol_1048p32 [Vanderwaltozyma polyspora DSM 70294]
MMISDDKLCLWKETKTIGIIGLGDMGLLYARKFSEAGWKVVCCDQEKYFQELSLKYAAEKFEIVLNGHFVSRSSDFIIYSVEAENIDKIVSLYGPSTKVNAIVGGQTSCKNPEIKAFEKHLPSDVDIITVHSLHGPRVNTEGQPLVIIDHRSKQKDSFEFVDTLMSCLKSKHVYLSYEEHDKITADTQAVTHAAFLSMGLTWAKLKVYPWTMGISKWNGGLENVKINISMRIFSNKWHVYAGLAITNPAAHQQVLQYATSVTEIFTLMLDNKKEELRERLYKAKQFVFGDHTGLLLLDSSLLDKYSLNKENGSTDAEGKPLRNSHLSLLAIVDSWYQLGINPYDHMICSTPLFRIFLGVTEYLFLNDNLLEETIDSAVNDLEFRRDDLEFVISARSWSSIISFSNFELYKTTFEGAQKFFEPSLPEANRIGNEMIKTILSHSK